MATAQLSLAKLVLIVALLVVFQTCRSQRGYANNVCIEIYYAAFINEVSDIQGVLQEIQSVAVLLDSYSKECSDMYPELVEKAMQVCGLLLPINISSNDFKSMSSHSMQH